MLAGPVVVKVGGSLLGWPALPDRLEEYLANRVNERLIVIIGGGRAADLVRALDAVHGLGDSRAHTLALRALDLTAHLLAALVPRLRVVEALGEIPSVWALGRVPLLAPRRFLEDDDRRSTEPLEHSWDVTTDSIAARAAERLGSSELVLLKSAGLPRGTTRDDAARFGLVDPAFPVVSRRLDRVVYRNFRDPSTSDVLLPRPLDRSDVAAAESESGCPPPALPVERPV